MDLGQEQSVQYHCFRCSWNQRAMAKGREGRLNTTRICRQGSRGDGPSVFTFLKFCSTIQQRFECIGAMAPPTIVQQVQAERNHNRYGRLLIQVGRNKPIPRSRIWPKTHHHFLIKAGLAQLAREHNGAPQSVQAGQADDKAVGGTSTDLVGTIGGFPLPRILLVESEYKTTGLTCPPRSSCCSRACTTPPLGVRSKCRSSAVTFLTNSLLSSVRRTSRTFYAAQV